MSEKSSDRRANHCLTAPQPGGSAAAPAHTHLFNSCGHMVSDTLIDRVRHALAAALLHEGQKGLFKHGRGAEDDDGEAVVLVGQAQRSRQHGVVPAYLRRR